MNTDLEHLFKVISGEITGIGVGKTTAYSHLLASYVNLTNETDFIIYVQNEFIKTFIAGSFYGSWAKSLEIKS